MYAFMFYGNLIQQLITAVNEPQTGETHNILCITEHTMYSYNIHKDLYMCRYYSHPFNILSNTVSTTIKPTSRNNP